MTDHSETPDIYDIQKPNTEIRNAMKKLTTSCHLNSITHGFWEGKSKEHYPEKIALIHSELSELLEELRQPNVDMESVAEELADVCIRIYDLAGHMKINLGQAILDKMAVNATRPNKHGKRF